jgi:hypothetical protein
MRGLVKKAVITLGSAGFLAVIWFIATSDARRAVSDFQWFGTLGFPDVKDCPYVQVATGAWSQSGNDPPRNTYVNGFLLFTNTNYFRVLTLDLSIRMFTNSAVAKPEYERVGFQILNFKREAELRLKELRIPPGKNNFFRRFGAQVPEETEVFVLSWACWRQGHRSAAMDLYREADKLPKNPASSSRRMTVREKVSDLCESAKTWFQKSRTPKPTMREKMEKSIAHKLMWSAVVEFGDPAISRPELQKQFESILRYYPHSEHRQQAQTISQILNRMIAEDRAHPRISPEGIPHLHEQERVRELIFQLRDQNGHQWSQPGSCDIFDDWGGVTNTPAHQLLKLGYAAVPQLIAALDSDALSRSVGYHRNFYFSHHVLTVGDCAEQILERMTGKYSFSSGSGAAQASESEEPSARRKAAEEWWAEFQRKGEQQMLIEGVSAGGIDAPAQARMLRERYHDIAVPAITKGIQAAGTSWERNQLLNELSKINGPAVEDFLRHELTEGPTLESRVTAANGLFSHDKNVAIAAMIREWQKLLELSTGKREETEGGGVIQFLASCNSEEAIVALGTNLSRLGVNEKYTVVESIGDNGTSTYWQKTDTLSPKVVETSERILVAALEDTDERVGMSGSINGKSFTNPRICDIAAWKLAERWTNRYFFDISASLKLRDRQRVECINTWRRSRGLEPMPLPYTDGPQVSRDDATKVINIQWATNSAAPEQVFAAAVADLRGKRLKARDLAKLLTNFAGHPPPNVAGLELRANRDEDLSGVRLFLKLMAGDSQFPASNCSFNEDVTLGQNQLLGSGGGGTWEGFSKEADWEDFSEAAEKALSGPPETAAEITVSIRGDRK